MSSAEGFSNAFIERIEVSFRVDDRTEAITLAYQNTTVQTIVNAIPRLKHRAVAWKRTVVGDKLELLATITRGV